MESYTPTGCTLMYMYSPYVCDIEYLYRLYGRPTATYESASTREFYHGRTDTIRSCTNEALAFVKTMVNPATSVSTRTCTVMGTCIDRVRHDFSVCCCFFLTGGREEAEYGSRHKGTL